MSRRRRLRLTCQGALHLALWRLSIERRRTVEQAAAARETTRPKLEHLYLLWGAVGLLVLATIAFTDLGRLERARLVDMPLALAAVVALCGAAVHFYSFEKGVWPVVREVAFPATPFGPPRVTRALQRTVWHLHTVSWLGTSVLLFRYALLEPREGADQGELIAAVVLTLALYWLAVVAAAFFVVLFSLGGDTFSGIAGSLQWVIVLVMVALMYWGSKTPPGSP